MRNSWITLFADIFNKTWLGLSAPGPTFYFISIIVIAGGVGIWLPLIQGVTFTPQTVMTYIFALLSAVMADFLTQEDKRSSISKDFSIFIISMVVIVICATVISLQAFSAWWAILFPLVLTWWLWWLLLEERKFDISPRKVEKSTIGSDSSEGYGEGKSLAALKAEKAKMGK